MKNNNNFMELLTSNPSVWYGKCKAKGKNLLLVFTPQDILYVGVSIDSKKLMIEGTEKVNTFKNDIIDILKIVEPKANSLATAFGIYEELPEEYMVVSSDYNKELQDKKIKVVGKTEVLKALNDKGIDVSKYTYVERVVDNSFTLKIKPLTSGKENWSEDQKKYAEDFDFAAKYTPSYPQKMKAFLNGAFTHQIFDGRPSCGKSYEGKIWVAKNEIPAIHISCHSSLDVDTLFGCERPNTNGEGFTFVYGPLYYAIKFGLTALMDEFRTLPVESQNLLLSLCEDHTKTYTLANGEIIDIHPDFRIIATANVGTAGNRDTSEALTTRFISTVFDDLTKEQWVERLSHNELYEYNNNEFIETLVEKLMKLQDYYDSCNFKTVVAVRTAQKFVAAILADRASVDFSFFASCFVDCTKINGDVNDMVELKELREMTQPYYDEVMATLDSQEETDSASVGIKLTAHLSLDDLDAQMNEAAKEQGVPIEEEDE